MISPGPCTPGGGRDLDRGARAPSPRPGSRRSASAWATRRWSRPSAAHDPRRADPRQGRGGRARRRGALRRPAEPAARRPLPLADRGPRAAGELERTATYGDVVMGVRHRELPAEGVQFHPESVLTPDGKQLLANFLATATEFQRIRRATRAPGPGSLRSVPEPTQFLSGPRTWIPSVRVSELAGRQWGVVDARPARRGRHERRRGGARGPAPGLVAPLPGRLRRRPRRDRNPGPGLRRADARRRRRGPEPHDGRLVVGGDRERARGDPSQRPRSPALGPGVSCVHTPRVLLRTVHRRLPVTPIRRTLLDLASWSTSTRCAGRLPRPIIAACSTLVRRTRPSVGVVGRLGAAPGSGASPPRTGRGRKRLEERFLALIQSRGLPIPEVQARIGPFRVDALWRSERVVAELDGHRSHKRAARAEADRRRDLELRARGYVVLRYTRQQITHAPDAVIADLRRALSL